MATPHHAPYLLSGDPLAIFRWHYDAATQSLQIIREDERLSTTTPLEIQTHFNEAAVLLRRLAGPRTPFELLLTGSDQGNRCYAYRIQGAWREQQQQWEGNLQHVTCFEVGMSGTSGNYYAGTATTALQLLIDNTEESFIVVDHLLRIVLFNKQFFEGYQAAYHRPVIIGDNFLTYVDDDRKAHVAAIFEKVSRGEAWQDEMHLFHDGETRYFLNRYKPAYKESGELYGAFLTSTDITQKRVAEHELIASERRFRTLVENGGDAISILLPNGTPAYISPSIERVLGYSEQEAMQINLFDIIHPAYVESVKDVWKSMMDKPGLPTPSHISRIRHKDGQWRFIEATVTNMTNDPAIGGYVDNFRDVTARVIASKEMAKAQNFLNKAEDLGQLGSAEINYKQKTVDWSDGLYRILGLEPRTRMTISKAIEYIHPEDRQHFIATQEHALSVGLYEFDLEMRLVRSDGVVRQVSLQAMVQYNDKGVAERAFAVVQDITQRSQHEAALHKLHEQVEARAFELARSNEELERFAYVASHDLQEPLRMVSSFMQLLERQYSGQLDDRAKEYISFAVDGANRMKRLILDLLEYSRVGTNKDSMQLVNLNTVAADIKSMFESKPETPLDIIIHPLPEVLGIRSQITQLFQNLISNGLKYNTSAQRRIEIGCLDKTTEWEFYVRDNGIGIDEQFYEKVFVIFQRLHNKNKYSGTGIGLAICKKIVERHGGQIRVESVPGQGSVFYFTMNKSIV